MSGPSGWTDVDREVVEWFVGAHATGRLPDEPFQLTPAARIAHPAKWYAAIKLDITAGPRGARAGVLVDELQRLREVVPDEAMGDAPEGGRR